MVDYAKYYTATGQILGVWSSTNERAVALATSRLKEGEALHIGQVDAATQYLPGGILTPKPEEPPAIVAADVKAWAGRILSYTDWVDIRSINGAPADPSMLAYRQAVRDASNVIEAMSPIPADYRDPKYWPVAP